MTEQQAADVLTALGRIETRLDALGILAIRIEYASIVVGLLLLWVIFALERRRQA
jgi:hypothetical protein